MYQQIIDNKLIAEFMDYKHNGEAMAHMAVNYKKQYHKDWNWLMPVVKKICKKIVPMNMNSAMSSIRYEILDDALYSNDIYDAYTSVVKLIKWYNKEEL